MNTDALIRSTRRTVLIVEDEAINRELLGQILSQSYDVLSAENGLQAIEIARHTDRQISMILLDINMPVMDGYEYLRIAQADEVLSQIPVIALTADRESKAEALRMGALDYIKKPYDTPEIILARVRRSIEFVEDRQTITGAEHDVLTGLYTRGFFHQYGRRLLNAKDGRQYDMLALDIDHFRMVNEAYGKGTGNRVLRAVADGLLQELRKGFGIACRADADQFYALIQHREDHRPTYDAITERLRRLGSQVNARVRMGVYPNVSTRRPIDWYSSAAKSACATIRGNYQRSIVVYDDALHEQQLFNERLVSDMDVAFRDRQFKIYLQPKYAVQGKAPRLIGAEALIRWQHPELGFISPGQFIPLFEDNGLILNLDHYVWNEAARLARAWQDRLGVRLPVSVNLSRMDFFDKNLRRRLNDIVRDNGITVRDLILEITESAYAQNTDQMLRCIRELREDGFRIEMDDFGSGYSSLNMLCVMPIDAMKIDMKFVQNIVTGVNGYRIVELVIQMARVLGIPAVVEGVENEAQYRLMRQAGCDIVQGYYFSRPMDAESFERLIAEQRVPEGEEP